MPSFVTKYDKLYTKNRLLPKIKSFEDVINAVRPDTLFISFPNEADFKTKVYDFDTKEMKLNIEHFIKGGDGELRPNWTS